MPTPSEIDDDLSQRLDRIESVVIKIIGTAVLVLLLVGWVLPWFDEGDPNLRLRLVTSGYYAFFPPPGVDTGGGASTSDTVFTVLFGASFVFLDVMTLITAVLVTAMMLRGWNSLRAGKVLSILTLICLAGAGLISLLAAAGGMLHPASILMWGLGVLGATAMFFNGTLRALWW